MRLTAESWYVRWFFWSFGILEEFREGYNGMERMKRDGTNLCFFFQTVFVYAPLIVILHLAVYGAAIASLTLVPVYVFGGWGYVSGILAIILLVALVFGVIHLRRKAKQRRIQRQRELAGGIKPEVITSPTFRRVAKEWVFAQKRKICPTITFSGNQGVRS